MHEDRERLHEQHLASESRDRSDGSRNPDQQEPEAGRSETPSTAGLSDSEQAQANLESMLESGEENPIS